MRTWVMSQVLGVPFASTGEYRPSYPGNARHARINLGSKTKRYGKFVFNNVKSCVCGAALSLLSLASVCWTVCQRFT